MDITSLKGTVFGGYSKKSVHEFFEELALSHSIKLSELAEEKGALIDKVTELEKKIASLEEALGNSENDKEHVAKAIVSAEKEAAKILANAASEAELLKDLRLSTLQAMTAYKDKLDAISKRLGGEE